mmetsp:Transcript_26388/g.67149  ORF Transcript_26388/g.67149 Transcript_26388/m.67149 type:complete len:90 (-) Transcript_26388:350-619(-)
MTHLRDHPISHPHKHHKRKASKSSICPESTLLVAGWGTLPHTTGQAQMPPPQLLHPDTGTQKDGGASSDANQLSTYPNLFHLISMVIGE